MAEAEAEEKNPTAYNIGDLPDDYHELLRCIGTFCALLHALFGERCPYYRQCYALWTVMNSDLIHEQRASFDALYCRQIVWAVLMESRVFFNQQEQSHGNCSQGERDGTDTTIVVSYSVVPIRSCQTHITGERSSCNTVPPRVGSAASTLGGRRGPLGRVRHHYGVHTYATPAAYHSHDGYPPENQVDHGGVHRQERRSLPHGNAQPYEPHYGRSSKIGGGRRRFEGHLLQLHLGEWMPKNIVESMQYGSLQPRTCSCAGSHGRLRNELASKVEASDIGLHD